MWCEYMINLFIMILFSRMPCCYPPEQHTAINMVTGQARGIDEDLTIYFLNSPAPVAGNVHLRLSFQWQGFPFPPSMWGQRIPQNSHIFLLMAKLFSKENSGSVLFPHPTSWPFISHTWISQSVSSVAQSCPTLCHPMNRSTPGLPVHHQLPESTQTHVHRVDDAIQPPNPLSSPSPPALNLSQHQGLFKWVSSSHQAAKVLEFQLQHQPFQWTPRTDLL